MITIALRTGLRLGELLALRWSDVDVEGDRIVVRRSVSRLDSDGWHLSRHVNLEG
jgi:integrase